MQIRHNFYLLLAISSILITHCELAKEASAVIKKRVLIGSPVYQKPLILKEFLLSLEELKKENCECDYLFIDDNENAESSTILLKFMEKHEGHCLIHRNTSIKSEQYICNEVTHFWKESIVWKVAAFKDAMIQFARKENYDYLFLIDSDMVLHPNTLEQLIADDKEIISEIWWTNWLPANAKSPSVWLYDHYTQYEIGINEQICEEEKMNRHYAFINQLLTPGVHEIGGLCTCTLINKTALHKGISFSRIKNLTFWGEDRHFCVRASALGIKLFVDTHYPAYHIYRESELKGVEEYKQNCRNGIYTI